MGQRDTVISDLLIHIGQGMWLKVCHRREREGTDFPGCRSRVGREPEREGPHHEA